MKYLMWGQVKYLTDRLDHCCTSKGKYPMEKIVARNPSTVISSLQCTILIITILGLVNLPCWAQTCFDYGTYCHWVGGVPTGGIAEGIDVSGNLACVAVGGSGVRVLDISNPSQPTILGTANTPGSAYDVTIAGDYAYVADRIGGLQVVAFKVLPSPVIVGSFATADEARDVAIAGNIAYVAVNGAGIQVLDISVPNSPQLLSTLAMPGTAVAVCTEGPFVYVGLLYDGMAVVNVSDPAAPTIVGTFDTPDSVWDLAVQGTTVYAADHTGGLNIIDASIPSAPTSVGAIITNFMSIGVTVLEDRLYVCNGADGLGVFTLHDPLHPVLLNMLQGGGSARDVALGSGHAFVASFYNGLQVMDISKLELSPPALGVHTASGSINTVVTSGSFAYVVADSRKLVVLDVSEPGVPHEVGYVLSTESIKDIALQKELVFAATGVSGLSIFDVGNPQSPSLISILDTPGSALSVGVSGDIACVLDRYDSKLNVIDASSPVAPVLVGSVDINVWPSAVYCRGDFAYVLAGESLYTVDISVPAFPVIVSTVSNSAGSLDMAVAGDYAYLAGYDAGDRYGFLKIFDLNDPGHPVAAGEILLLDYTRAVAVADGIAYVGINTVGLLAVNSGLQVVDVADPYAPVLLGVANTPDSAVDVAIADGFVLVAGKDAGLQIHAPQCGVSGVESLPRIQRSLGLSAFPNPFNPHTTIHFNLPNQTEVRLQVFDMSGRFVRNLIDGELAAEGENVAVWNGCDEAGQRVASGTYFYRLEAGKYSETNRVALIK
jgi:hypothetical protein